MLDKIELFADLSNKELEDVLKITKRLQVKRGEIIFTQGEFTRDFFVIESGQIEIAVKDQLQEFHTVATLKNGDFFGEMALFDKNSARSATARSAQNSILLQIPGTEFEQLLQQKPNLSFKLLGALSRRLRESNARTFRPGEKPRERNAKIISVASPRTGDGKTTFAMGLAHHLSGDLNRQVLYIDLDLTFADGTYFLGVYSLRNICDIVSQIPQITEHHHLTKNLISLSENLQVIPGTTNVIDGERIKAVDFVSLLKICRKFYDYIVIDTESKIEDIFLNALDVSDRIFFLVDHRDIFSIKCASRFLAGIRKLNFSDERLTVLATKSEGSFKADQLEKLLKIRVFGAIPTISGYTPEYGVSQFKNFADSPFMDFLREVSGQTLNEASAKSAGKGFLTRLFFGGTQGSGKAANNENGSETCKIEFPAITPENLRVIMRYIRGTYLNGNFEEARQQTVQILTYCPKSSLVYQLLGEIHIAEGSISDAIECFRKTIDLDPKNHFAIGHLGIWGNDDELVQKATGILHAKIQEHPNYPDLHKDLGVLLLTRKEFEPAIDAFRQALKANPSYFEAQVHLADALGQQGKYPEAIELLAAIPQKNLKVYYLLGNHLHALGRFHEAITAYRNVLKVNPAYEDAAKRLETLDGYFEKVRSLIVMHEEIIRTRPSFPDIHLKLGMMYSEVGRRAEAANSFKKALELNPNFEEARNRLESLQEIREVELSDPDDRGNPSHPCHSVTCNGFSLHFRLGDWAQKPEERLNLTNHLVTVHNVRTSKSQTIRLSSEMIKQGEFDVCAEEICPIADGDLVVARIIDPSNSQPLMSIPYSCDTNREPNCTFTIELKEPLRQLASKLGSIPPIQHFLVSLESANLSQVVGKSMGGYHAFVENPRNGIRTEGKLDSDSPTILGFVLHSANADPVVLPGDKLYLNVVDDKGNPVLKWEFTIFPHDIQAFCKAVVLDKPAAKSSAG